MLDRWIEHELISLETLFNDDNGSNGEDSIEGILQKDYAIRVS